MIVTKNSITFLPVEISVTFQTQEELSLFKVMMSYKTIIPDLISANAKDKEVLYSMMNSILDQLDV